MNIQSTLSKNIQIITGSIITISLNSAIPEDSDTQDKLQVKCGKLMILLHLMLLCFI